jgi:hypothetical protein
MVIYGSSSTSPFRLEKCVFKNCITEDAKGGGAACIFSNNVAFIDCTFITVSTAIDGGLYSFLLI